MKITLHNSISRRDEEFTPITPGEVKMYSCGPTVYNFAHIGNFRAYMVSDLLHRTLLLAGYKVTLVMNLTDVDDKTIRGARAEKLPLASFTEQYKKAFFEDIATLRIKPASVYPSATEHIPEMVSIIQRLTERGHTYTADGSIYFRLSSFPDYGRLANLEHDVLKAGASGRVAADEYEKENVSDFALWKGYTEGDGDVFWETALGKGRPGWHIECSAMSTKYLGDTFDIHTGGIDNKFPHHENEIAQTECATGKKFVNYWLHNEHLIVDGEKMSKSKGNFYTLRDLIAKGYDARAIRYLLISSHYRKQLNFSLNGILQSAKALERMNDVIFRLHNVSAHGSANDALMAKLADARTSFRDDLGNDLNIAGSLGAVFDLIREVNASFSAVNKVTADAILDFFRTDVNGILDCLTFEEENAAPEIEALLRERADARKAKDFKRSDEIRDTLKAMGIEIFDTPSGATWKKTK